MPVLTDADLEEMEADYRAWQDAEACSAREYGAANLVLARLPDLVAEVRRLREENAAQWEADHQRAALERHGLAEEFPFGCDAIDHVAAALVAARRRQQAAVSGDESCP